MSTSGNIFAIKNATEKEPDYLPQKTRKKYGVWPTIATTVSKRCLSERTNIALHSKLPSKKFFSFECRLPFTVVNMAEAHEDPRIFFAAERTFLAWIRTGLALMGIGFAVSRFGLFLRQLHMGGTGSHNTGVSLYSGVALVALGVLVNVGAVIYHVRTTRALRAGTWTPGVSFNAVTLALLLAMIGVGMGIFLLVME